MLLLCVLSACKQMESIPVDGSQPSLGESPPVADIPDYDDSEPEVEDPPAVSWYKVSKPTTSDSNQKVIEKCQSLGERDRQFKINNFLIAFEGLSSFNSQRTEELYQAFEKDPEMKGLKVPDKKGSGGFMVNYLLWPALIASSGSTDFTVWPEPSIKDDQIGAQPDLCARAWLVGNPNGKLIITGHSYGGHAANQLADVLDQQNIPIDSVVTVDARTKRYKGDLFKTSNAGYWVNFYQTNTAFLNGYVVDGADENINLSRTGTSHGKIPGRIEVKSALIELLND